MSEHKTRHIGQYMSSGYPASECVCGCWVTEAFAQELMASCKVRLDSPEGIAAPFLGYELARRLVGAGFTFVGDLVAAPDGAFDGIPGARGAVRRYLCRRGLPAAAGPALASAWADWRRAAPGALRDRAGEMLRRELRALEMEISAL